MAKTTSSTLIPFTKSNHKSNPFPQDNNQKRQLAASEPDLSAVTSTKSPREHIPPHHARVRHSHPSTARDRRRLTP
eukprot:3250320-Rhodomonas_salina.1